MIIYQFNKCQPVRILPDRPSRVAEVKSLLADGYSDADIAIAMNIKIGSVQRLISINGLRKYFNK